MRETKVVNTLDNMWPFDSPRDDNERADNGCFKSSSVRTVGRQSIGENIGDALVRITCKQWKGQLLAATDQAFFFSVRHI